MKHKVNDIVNFIGCEHFTASTQSAISKTCKPGLARVDMLAENSLYPYHMIAEPYGKSSVYGWVKVQDIQDITANDAIDRLTYIKVLNSPDYWKNFIKIPIAKYVDSLIIKCCQLINNNNNSLLSLNDAIDKLITVGIINTPEYWKEQAIKYNNISFLIIKLASAIDNIYIKSKSNEDLRNKFIQTAQSYLGYNEWDGTHQIIIDIYNNYGNLPRSYAVQYTDSWCATYVSAMAILCGLADTVIPRECSCEHQINLFKKLGVWVEDDTYMPSNGDIVYYTWDGDEYTENTQWSDHVGIVIDVTNEHDILVIEGNKNDQVSYRTIWKNYPYIRGYATPKY